MQPTGVELVGTTIWHGSGSGSEPRAGRVISFNRAQGSYKVRWEDRSEGTFSEDELTQILAQSQEDALEAAEGGKKSNAVVRKRGRPRKSEAGSGNNQQRGIVKEDDALPGKDDSGDMPRARGRGRPKKNKTKRRGRPPKTSPGKEANAGGGETTGTRDGDGAEASEASKDRAEAEFCNGTSGLETSAKQDPQKAALDTGASTPRESISKLSSLRERPARNAAAFASPQKVASLSQGRKSFERNPKIPEQGTPVKKGKRRVVTNYTSGKCNDVQKSTFCAWLSIVGVEASYVSDLSFRVLKDL